MSVVVGSIRWTGASAALMASIVLAATSCGSDAEVPADPAAARGRELTVQLGCAACHTRESGDEIGPDWDGSWGTSIELDDGSSVIFDATYVESAVRRPADQPRAGDWIRMPAYPESLLTDDDLADIVTYLESRSTP